MILQREELSGEISNKGFLTYKVKFFKKYQKIYIKFVQYFLRKLKVFLAFKNMAMI